MEFEGERFEVTDIWREGMDVLVESDGAWDELAQRQLESLCVEGVCEAERMGMPRVVDELSGYLDGDWSGLLGRRKDWKVWRA